MNRPPFPQEADPQDQVPNDLIRRYYSFIRRWNVREIVILIENHIIHPLLRSQDDLPQMLDNFPPTTVQRLMLRGMDYKNIVHQSLEDNENDRMNWMGLIWFVHRAIEQIQMIRVAVLNRIDPSPQPSPETEEEEDYDEEEDSEYEIPWDLMDDY